MTTSVGEPPRVGVLTKISGIPHSVVSECPPGSVQDLGPIVDPVCMQALLSSCEILVADPGACFQWKEQLEHAVTRGKLRWIQSTWVGVERLVEALGTVPLERHPIVTKLSAALGPGMLEYTLMHIIAYERSADVLQQQQRNHLWQDVKPYRTLGSLTVGIMGYGDIAKHVVRGLQFMGAKVIVLRRTGPFDRETFFSSEEADDLKAFLSCVDYLVNLLPHTTQTVGFLTTDMLSYCSTRSPVLLNMGRGSIISERTVLEGLTNGTLRHAVLDVFATEPLPPTSPLWSHPKVTITPHNSALTPPEAFMPVFTANYRKYVDGERSLMQYIVNLERGY